MRNPLQLSMYTQVKDKNITNPYNDVQLSYIFFIFIFVIAVTKQAFCIAIIQWNDKKNCDTIEKDVRPLSLISQISR